MEVVGSRKCNYCLQTKSIKYFDRCSRTKIGVRSKCKKCRSGTERASLDIRIKRHNKSYYQKNKKIIRARVDKWTINNKNKVKINKRKWLVKKYKITLEFYEKLYKHQNGKCKICSKNIKVLAVDHCHKTGNIRGLLCRKCNSGIGFLNDDPKLVKKALKYLNEKPITQNTRRKKQKAIRTTSSRQQKTS